VVTTVNKLIPRKNVDLFLRAMSDVARRRPGVHGVVVGHGPFERRLRRLADRLELGGVVSFTGFLPGPDELAACYAAADVYVFLERNVPFGLTVVEASAAGVPVVAFRGGGTSDTVVDGMTGRLLDPDAGEGEVADQICWLLEHREERLAMGRRAAREAQRFEHPAAVRAFLRALQDTVGGAAA
jgi:phosphatidylinositol alpha-1,6-mannosyltransferase